MKKYLLSLVFLFGIVAACFAQENEIKYYKDAKKGYEGYAMTMYLGSMANFGFGPEVDPADIMKELTNEFKKSFEEVYPLSDYQYWLVDEAMSTYPVNPGDFYLTFIAESEDAEEGLLVIICSTYDGDCYSSYIVSESDLYKLDDLF
ncbi:MAG: hypothetical protein MJ174_07085 [Treponema sp.]|nr:hypothetical protein [Treponema sp.]